MVIKTTKVGMEIFPGITIKWEWIDGVLIGIIAKGEAGINALAVEGVGKLNDAFQSLVDKTELQFDNIAKVKIEKAFTLAMVKRFMPELLPGP